MPRISVIIPVYNGEEFIEEALDSVFVQTFRDFEVVVVNDGSTDGTETILRKYESRIRCITQENQGLVASRARGLAASTGEWIAFLDADDIWLPEKLERQIAESAIHSQCGIVATDFLSFERDKIVCSSVKEWYRPGNGYVWAKLLFGNWITPSAAMVRRECFDCVKTFGLAKPGFGEDWLMWMQILPHYPVRFIDEVLVRRRIHSQNMSRVDEENQFSALLRNFDLLEKLVPEIRESPATVRKALHKICMNRGKRNLMALKLDLARDKFRRATRYKPFSTAAWIHFAIASLPDSLLNMVKERNAQG